MSRNAALFYVFLSHLPTQLNSRRTPHTFTHFILMFYYLQLSLCDTVHCNTGILEEVNGNTVPGVQSQKHMGKRKNKCVDKRKKKGHEVFHIYCSNQSHYLNILSSQE